MFQNHANLVLEVRLDRDLHAVRDTFAIFPHVVNQQVAKRCHAVADRETQVGHAAVRLSLGGWACNTTDTSVTTLDELCRAMMAGARV